MVLSSFTLANKIDVIEKEGNVVVSTALIVLSCRPWSIPLMCKIR